AHLEQRNAKRCIDVARSAAHDARIARAAHQRIHPVVITQTRAHDELRVAQLLHVGRARLVRFGIASWRDHRLHVDQVSAGRARERCEIGSRRDHDDRSARAATRERRDDGNQREATHVLFGTRQCTTFCAPAGAASRQSITMLASPYASRRERFFCFSSTSSMAQDASSMALLRSSLRPTVTMYFALSRSGRASIARRTFGFAMKQCRPLFTSTTCVTRQSQVDIMIFSTCSCGSLRCSARSFVVSARSRSSALLRSRSMPTVIHASLVSMRGHSSFMFLSTSTVTFISLYAVSRAVRLISPLPCAACES